MSQIALNTSSAIGQSTADAHAPVRIAMRNLNFYYGDAPALKNVSLDFHDRQVTALIGPSGCGKSTLLRTCNRIYSLYPEQRADGEILLDGQNILSPSVDVNELRARVGMVFQKPTPFPMSIYDNIAFGIRPMRSCPNPNSMAASRKRSRKPRSGTKRGTSCGNPGSASQAGSSSAFASRAPSHRTPRSFFSTSPRRRSTRSRPERSRS